MSELQITIPKLRRRNLTVGLFDSKLNSVLTVVCLVVIAWLLTPLLRWATSDAIWWGPAQDCTADGAGACWAFIGAKLRFILFGFYTPALQWRPLVVIVAIGGLLASSSRPRFWSRRLLIVWPVVIILCWLLMAGTFLPVQVPTNQWGWGADHHAHLADRTDNLVSDCAPAGAGATLRDEDLAPSGYHLHRGLRGVPLIAVLYVAMLIVPMAPPADALTDKLLRAQIGITLFVSAYLAEVIRAGLQAIPAGQTEAAYALGLGYWRTAQLVVLPQALRAVIPAVVNLSIGIVLNTSLLAVIGISDLLNAAKTAATDPNWLGYYTEAFVFSACVYFAISFGASRYSLWLEARLRAAQ